jgi:hypothetical protein
MARCDVSWIVVDNRCLVAFSLLYFMSELLADSSVSDGFLLCRSCGHEVTDSQHFIRKPSILAKRIRNDTVLGVQGVLIQLFENPHGKQFEVITSSSADVFRQDQAFGEHSWFPGFLWHIVVCPRCGYHLGWSFEPADHQQEKVDTDQTFIALILDHLLHQDFADSLLITPKFYRS